MPKGKDAEPIVCTELGRGTSHYKPRHADTLSHRQVPVLSPLEQRVFQQACSLVKVAPTPRQLRKWTLQKGAAWKVHSTARRIVEIQQRAKH